LAGYLLAFGLHDLIVVREHVLQNKRIDTILPCSYNQPGDAPMVLTPSTMLDLGTTAPDFTLNTADNKPYSLAEQSIDKGLLVIFMCNHCPYVLHIAARLSDKISDYQQQRIAVVAINSNDSSSYPDDSPEKMITLAESFGFTFPYLVDEKQDIAKIYQAACTPDFFLFNQDKKLVYRGQFDNARPGNKEPISGEDLTSAVNALLAASPVSRMQKASMGCNIKWKPGNEPNYFSPPQAD
jgi:peroxiredoxin